MYSLNEKRDIVRGICRFKSLIISFVVLSIVFYES
jgi:hypothetical protein